MTGITLRCAACYRPIVGHPMVNGSAGEPYHAECVGPPPRQYAQINVVHWRHIENAPRDGTAILRYTPERTGYVATQQFDIIHWSEWGGGAWESVGGGKPTCRFSHWMPLPDAPSN